MKYKAKIIDIGPDALDFREGECLDFIVIFNNTAPSELREIAVIQDRASLVCDPEVGDNVQIGENQFTISAVGYEAVNTLRSLGHCTLSFKGKTEVERPGIIELQGNSIYPGDIKIGEEIKITTK